jgi:hypothetical protein
MDNIVFMAIIQCFQRFLRNPRRNLLAETSILDPIKQFTSLAQNGEQMERSLVLVTFDEFQNVWMSEEAQNLSFILPEDFVVGFRFLHDFHGHLDLRVRGEQEGNRAHANAQANEWMLHATSLSTV